MKRLALLFVPLLFAGALWAQNPPPPPTSPPQTTPPASPTTTEKSLNELLGWLIGEWEGEGVSANGPFVGKLSAVFELDNEAILVRRESMNKPGGPSGGLKELMLIGFDGTTKKIIMTLYNNKNFIALYAGELNGTDLVFNSKTAPSGYTDRRTFKQLPDGGISFFTEAASPGKAVSKIVEIKFKKKM
jgi:hypothetical protein